MRTSTKILLIIASILLVPSVALAMYLFRAITPTESGFEFNMTPLAWVDLVCMMAFSIVGFALFLRFLKRLKLKNAIFLSIAPLTLTYGAGIVYLTAVKSMDDTFAQSVKAMMNIKAEQASYTQYLWAGILTIVYLFLAFLIISLTCKPLSKVEKIADKISDGRLKNDNIKIGGGKQFQEIEHSLSKINFNNKERENKLRKTNLKANKFANKELFKFFGTNAIDQLEMGNQIKKTATILQCDLKGKGTSKSINLEENFNYINSYIKTVCPLVKRFDGFVDKCYGEKILAVFSKPREAIECAHAIVKAIDVKNKSSKEKPEILTNISICTDDVLFAILGDSEQKLPTVVSQVKDVVGQMQEINSFIGTKILISKSTISALDQNYDFPYRFTGTLTLEDNCTMQIFESLCYYPKSKRDKLIKLRNKFEEGVRDYNLKHYDSAKENFEFVLHYVPDDEPSYVYFNKVAEKLSKPA